MDTTEAMEVGRRTANLVRYFDVRHGITPEVEATSARYGSAPVDGPAKGRNIAPELEEMLDNYYQLMGWDRKTGKPLPEKLRQFGLERKVEDLWKA